MVRATMDDVPYDNHINISWNIIQDKTPTTSIRNPSSETALIDSEKKSFLKDKSKFRQSNQVYQKMEYYLQMFAKNEIILKHRSALKLLNFYPLALELENHQPSYPYSVKANKLLELRMHKCMPTHTHKQKQNKKIHLKTVFKKFPTAQKYQNHLQSMINCKNNSICSHERQVRQSVKKLNLLQRNNSKTLVKLKKRHHFILKSTNRNRDFKENETQQIQNDDLPKQFNRASINECQKQYLNSKKESIFEIPNQRTEYLIKYPKKRTLFCIHNKTQISEDVELSPWNSN